MPTVGRRSAADAVLLVVEGDPTPVYYESPVFIVEGKAERGSSTSDEFGFLFVVMVVSRKVVYIVFGTK